MQRPWDPAWTLPSGASSTSPSAGAAEGMCVRRCSSSFALSHNLPSTRTKCVTVVCISCSAACPAAFRLQKGEHDASACAALNDLERFVRQMMMSGGGWVGGI